MISSTKVQTLTIGLILVALVISACVVPEELDEPTAPADDSPLSGVTSPLPSPSPTTTPEEEDNIIERPPAPKPSLENDKEQEEEMSEGSEQAVKAAKEALAERMKVSTDQIELVSVKFRQFRDSSLGCPKKGMMYLQVITPGHQVLLELDGETYDYRVARQQVVLCDGLP